MNIAVVDDDAAQRQALLALLEKYRGEKGLPFDVETFASGIEFLHGPTDRFDLLLLDIQMPGVNGLECARLVRERGWEGPIFFVTDYAQYAISAFDVDAKGYLVKPVGYPLLARQLDRVVPELARHEESYLYLGGSRDLRRVALSEVAYIVSKGHYVNIRTASGKLTELASIKELDEELQDKGFFRIGSGAIVNLAQVEAVDGQEVIVAGEKLQVSRARKKPFMDALRRYVSGTEG